MLSFEKLCNQNKNFSRLTGVKLEEIYYSDLFFNTCYYHAAVATYHLKDVESSKKYFREFLLLMNELCQNILDEKAYKTLLKNNMFNNEQQNIRDYFEKSLQIFEAIYWKGYEFTKYYVKLNIK